jgi:pimeloyl-ACP methyl ester carboxylesterase
VQEAFFFGSNTQQIYASYHPPAGGTGPVLTVLCPPLFSEYMRTHAALRELAVALAERDQHVLRFDFRGTGDSFGELEQLAVSDWIEDIVHVVHEGREISDCSEVRLLGTRASALLACKSMGISREVQRFVLWDPVPDGIGYLQALRHMQEELCKQNPYLGRGERLESMHEYSGYTLSERMVEELRSLDAGAYANVPREMLNVVSTTSGNSFPISGVRQHVSLFQCNWDTVSTELVVPRLVLERLVECLTRP